VLVGDQSQAGDDALAAAFTAHSRFGRRCADQTFAGNEAARQVGNKYFAPRSRI